MVDIPIPNPHDELELEEAMVPEVVEPEEHVEKLGECMLLISECSKISDSN